MATRLPSVLVVTLLLVGASLPTDAACNQSRPIVSFDFDAISYVYSPVCGASGCADNDGASVSSRTVGFFWGLGRGNPAVGAGIDSGSVPALDGILSLYPGYPAVVDTNWNRPGVDGCIDQGSVPTCTAVVLADLSAGCNSTQESCIHIAVATAAERDPGNSYVFSSPDGRIDLTTLPVVESPGQDDRDVQFSSIVLTVPRPVSSAYVDPICEEPLAGYRIYVREKKSSLPPPLTRAGWQLPVTGGTAADGAPVPFDTATRVVFGCDELLGSSVYSEGLWVAYSIVFEDGFELPWVEMLDAGDHPLSSPDGKIYCCTDVDADDNCVSLMEHDCDDHDPTVRQGGEQLCGDLKNNDCNHPEWPDLAGTNEVDNDGDGLSACDGDCDDSDPSIVGAFPLLVDSVRFEADDRYVTWDVEPGSFGRIYRTNPESWTDAPEFTCIGTDGAGQFFDPALPGPGRVFGYLVRAVNSCGAGPLGTDSAGNERVVFADCP